MPTHPDGTEFETHKDLLDYVDKLHTAEVEDLARQEATKEARFNQLVSEVDVVDKRKTRWHVHHDNMLKV